MLRENTFNIYVYDNCNCIEPSLITIKKCYLLLLLFPGLQSVIKAGYKCRFVGGFLK